MNTNLLIALKNIIQKPVVNLVAYYKGSNRINNVGEALEIYIKDVFCNSLKVESLNQKLEIYQENFSYLGNQNNPPDIMIRGGDAIEVKKIESQNSGIALNSSYPKDKLYSDSLMITQACRDSENWQEKDLLYVIGNTKNNSLKSVWFVYGDCLAANKEIYERISQKISSGLLELSGVEFAQTKELGRVNRVDPLGITDLRIRGMWHIKNPNSVFGYISEVKKDAEFVINSLILKTKYNSFPQEDRQNLENIKSDSFSIKDVLIKCPNNPAKLLEAKLISFSK